MSENAEAQRRYKIALATRLEEIRAEQAAQAERIEKKLSELTALLSSLKRGSSGWSRRR